MSTNRREFIERLGATAMLGALPLSLPHLAEFQPVSASAEDWDLSWTAKLKGKKHKACFDCAEIESGYPAWRASIWENQYMGMGGAKRADVITVLVLRHNAAMMALQQEFWSTYAVGKTENVTHPITQQSSDRNPALLRTSTDTNLPEMFDAFALPNFISRGGIVLVCNVALGFIANKYVAAKDGVPAADAHKKILTAIVPGAIVQPSGVLGAVRAQEEGCVYVRAG